MAHVMNHEEWEDEFLKLLRDIIPLCEAFVDCGSAAKEMLPLSEEMRNLVEQKYSAVNDPNQKLDRWMLFEATNLCELAKRIHVEKNEDKAFALRETIPPCLKKLALAYKSDFDEKELYAEVPSPGAMRLNSDTEDDIRGPGQRKMSRSDIRFKRNIQVKGMNLGALSSSSGPTRTSETSTQSTTPKSDSKSSSRTVAARPLADPLKSLNFSTNKKQSSDKGLVLSASKELLAEMGIDIPDEIVLKPESHGPQNKATNNDFLGYLAGLEGETASDEVSSTKSSVTDRKKGALDFSDLKMKDVTSFSAVDSTEDSFTAVRNSDREAEAKKQHPLLASEQYKLNRTTSVSQQPQIPPKPKTIDFTVKDSDDNIMFMTGNEGKIIKAATFSKLIERLTCTVDHCDPEDFLFSYRLFAEPTEVLNGLFERYHTSQEKAVKIRIFNLFKRWVEKFWHDFNREPGNITLMFNFVDPIINGNLNTNDIPMAKMVRGKIEQKQKETFITPDGGDDLCVPSEWAVAAESANNNKFKDTGPMLGIFEHTSQEIANHITLIEWEMWVKIRETELIGLGWTKKDKDTLSPNVCNMTKRFNMVSDWVATCICCEENPKKRVKLIVKFIEVADCLKTLGNYNGVLEIFSAFKRGPVARLAKSFGSLDANSQKTYSAINELTDNAKNYAALRMAVAQINPPVIPYLGMYLTDILFAIEGNTPHIAGLINFFRCRLYSENIKRIKQYQLLGFEIREKNLLIPNLYDNLLNLRPSLSEDDLYSVSSYIEPREGKEAGPRPDALIDTYLEQTKQVHGQVLNDKERKAERKREGNKEKESEKEAKKVEHDFLKSLKEVEGGSNLKRKGSTVLQKHQGQEGLTLTKTHSFKKRSESRSESSRAELFPNEQREDMPEPSESALLGMIDTQNKHIEFQNKQIELLVEQNKKLLTTQTELKTQIDKMADVQHTMFQNQNELLMQLQMISSNFPSNPHPHNRPEPNRGPQHK